MVQAFVLPCFGEAIRDQIQLKSDAKFPHSLFDLEDIIEARLAGLRSLELGLLMVLPGEKQAESGLQIKCMRHYCHYWAAFSFSFVIRERPHDSENSYHTKHTTSDKKATVNSLMQATSTHQEDRNIELMQLDGTVQIARMDALCFGGLMY